MVLREKSPPQDLSVKKTGRGAHRRAPGAASSSMASRVDALGAEGDSPVRRRAIWNKTFWFSLGSGLVLFAAMPPLNLWPLAWAAPIGWLCLIQSPRLEGRRPYLAVWAAGLIHWLLVLQGIRHAHWAVWIGWLVLSAYLAIYPMLFVGLTRVLTHRWRWPLFAAAPIVWTALEFLRGQSFVGFSGALLGHTQVHWLAAVQIADLAGAYTVSFVVMLVSSAAAQSLASGRLLPAPLATAAVVGAAAIGYGYFRLAERTPGEADGKSLKVALVQTSFDTVFDGDARRDIETFERARAATLAAARRHPDLDLVVWPESAYTGDLPDVVIEGRAKAPLGSELGDEEFRQLLLSWRAKTERKAKSLAWATNAAARPDQPKARNTHLIVGTGGRHFSAEGDGLYNTALWIKPNGQIAGRYHKTHPVMFGEYVPLGQMFPWLYRLMPMPQGLTPGPGPSAFAIDGSVVSPSICFESVVPQLIRRQQRQLARQGSEPDFLVNVTNDGWFHGSSILDIHRTCGVFRAIENRRPLLTAANTGPTAIIDGAGRVIAQAPRRREEVVIGVAPADGRRPLYSIVGDAPAAVCLFVAAAACLSGWIGRRRTPAPAKPA